MTLQLVYNTTDTMAVVDDDGRTVGGREWGTAETTDVRVKRLIDSGDLVIADEDSARAANLPAVAALDERRERKEKAEKLDKDKLREVVGDAADADASKAELVQDVAADPSIELPAPTTKKSGRSSASGN